MAERNMRIDEFFNKDGTIKRKDFQYVVLLGLIEAKEGIDDINKFFKKNDWGRMEYVMEWKTLSDNNDEKEETGGRTDVLFKLFMDGKQVGKFSVGRFAMGSNAPRWLPDYMDNNADIIPPDVYGELQKLRQW